MRPLLRFLNILACKFVDALAPDRTKGVHIFGRDGLFPLGLRRIAAQLVENAFPKHIATARCLNLLQRIFRKH